MTQDIWYQEIFDDLVRRYPNDWKPALSLAKDIGRRAGKFTIWTEADTEARFFVVDVMAKLLAYKHA